MLEDSNSNTSFYPNNMGRVFLLALQDVLLPDGYSALLNCAGLSHFIHKLPGDSWAKEFDFNNISSLNQALEQLYGPRGGRRLALQSGQKSFELGWGASGKLAGLSDVALKARTLQEKLMIGLSSIARLISDVSDQTTWIEEQAKHFEYHAGACPVCWNRKVEKPVCFHTVGFLQGSLHWFSSGLEFRIRQISCTAMGENHCVFRIDNEPVK